MKKSVASQPDYQVATSQSIKQTFERSATQPAVTSLNTSQSQSAS